MKQQGAGGVPLSVLAIFAAGGCIFIEIIMLWARLRTGKWPPERGKEGAEVEKATQAEGLDSEIVLDGGDKKGREEKKGDWAAMVIGQDDQDSVEKCTMRGACKDNRRKVIDMR